MAMYEKLLGEFYWVKVGEPEESPAEFRRPGEPPKYSWRVQFRPDKDSLMKIMDLQSMGVKNKLKKTEDGKGYSINFSRPTEVRKGKKGPVTKLNPPMVFAADGKTPITDPIGNGSKGELTIELYEHKTPTGTAHAARFYSMTVTDLIPYVRKEDQPSTAGWSQ